MPRKQRPKKPDPAANLFAIAVEQDGKEVGIARIESLTSLRHLVIENMTSGYFTEVAVLNLRQLEPVIKRITE